MLLYEVGVDVSNQIYIQKNHLDVLILFRFLLRCPTTWLHAQQQKKNS